MSLKIFTKASVKAAIYEAPLEEDVLVLEETGPWVSDGKYQEQEIILLEPATGKYWLYVLTRSGSPFTDYTYSFEWEGDEIELTSVVKTTKVIEVWV